MALETTNAARLGRLQGGDRVDISFALPEVQPRAAADGVEIAHLHDALTNLVHEGEVRIQIEHLDAIVGRGQHTAQEFSARSLRIPGKMRLSDVVALGEDARDYACLIEDGLQMFRYY